MGLLNYMLFGNAKLREERARYNAVVENLIRTHFNIDLDHITDSFLSKSQIYQNAYKLYNVGCNTNEATASIVGDYLEGMLHKSGMNDSAGNLARRLVMFIEQCVASGGFDKKRVDLMFSLLQKSALEYANKVA
jgi:hypothetical protein